MYSLTAADFADTGQWRLLINLYSDGLEASLENTVHPEIPRQQLCSLFWKGDKDSYLKNLEEAVYHNPRLLDDFATKIVIFDPATVFMPASMLETPGAEADIYNEIYKADHSDVMTDSCRGITAAWAMAPGVRGFLLRSFPGARLTCNLMERYKEACRENGGLRLIVTKRGNESDFVLIHDCALISASTHPIASRESLDKMISDILQAYGYEASEIIIEENSVTSS